MKFFICISLFSSMTWASPSFNYKSQWSDSGYIKADKKSSFKVFVKNSPILPNVPIAVVTLTRNNQETKNTVINLFKTSVGKDCNWKKDEIDGLEIHECSSLKTGTFFRIAYNNMTQQFSTGSVALRYLMPSYAEMHLLQREGLKSQSERKTSWLIELLNQKAYAETSDVSGYLSLTGQRISNAVRGITDAGNNIAGAGNNVAGSIDRASDRMNKTLSAGNVAKLSAVAGATFGLTSTLGSMTANFLVNGTYSMLKTFFYEAKGEFTPEQKKLRLERFEKSLKTFQELEPTLNEMASKLALASAELSLASGVTQEEFLANIDNEIANTRALSSTSSNGAAPACTEEEKALKIRQLEDFKKIVAVADKSKPKALVCENIENLYKTWVNSEYALLNSRRLVMQDLRVFNGTIIDGVESQNSFQENRKQNNACTESAREKLQKVERELNGQSCASDVSTVLCQKYEAYKGMLESCQEMANQKTTDQDEAELLTATSNVSKVLAQFSRDLGALSCDGKTNGCTQGKLDRVRTDIKNTFADASKQCPQYFFAKQFAPKASATTSSTALLESPSRAIASETPIESQSPSIWRSIKNFFNSPRKTNETAASEAIAWQKQYPN